MDILHGQSVHPGVAIAAAARLRTEYGVPNLDPRRLRRLGGRLRSFGVEVPEREQVILVAETVPPGFLLAPMPGLEFIGVAASASPSAIGGVPCPAVFGLGDTLLDLIDEDEILIVDGDRGRVYVAPDATILARYQTPIRQSRRFFIDSAHLPARTASDDRPVAVLAAAPTLACVPSAIESGADGLWIPSDNDFLGPEDVFQTSDEQRETLHSLLGLAGGKPVFLHIPPERLALSALARASAGGDLRLVLNDLAAREELADRLEELEPLLEEQDITFGSPRFEAGSSASDDLPETLDGFAGLCVTAPMEEIGIADLLLLSGLAHRGGFPLTIALLQNDWAETLPLALDLSADRVVVPLQALADVKDAIRAL